MEIIGMSIVYEVKNSCIPQIGPYIGADEWNDNEIRKRYVDCMVVDIFVLYNDLSENRIQLYADIDVDDAHRTISEENISILKDEILRQAKENGIESSDLNDYLENECITCLPTRGSKHFPEI